MSPVASHPAPDYGRDNFTHDALVARLENRLRRIALAGAFMAMAALVFAIPVHHGHMLQMQLAQVGGAAEKPASPTDEPHAHHHVRHAAGHDHGAHVHHHAAADDAQSAGADHEADHSSHDMPRCPVCSLAKAATALVAPDPVILSGRVRYQAPLPVADAVERPSSQHFSPVQPRAPPIVA
ncbi:hypothetical protein GRZ55_15375 [Chelativorans sp. ZYF759]|uniref:hypothetical protein n=1 Tax=Chelativorans sp. ZYF759 TaxID=2692213 RepID=UPI00145EBB4F|nr:hypothetical protein [Chelativorans sp. ZYF759]NMG40626.1 hypothetical protein [Chelativorans sp. ZYF759]